MTKTPQLSVDDDFSLNPLSKVALTPILNAFNEDPESAYSALPWLDKSPVKSIRYKGVLSRWALRLFVVSFFVLGWLGVMPATKTYTIMAQFFTLIYFAYFVLMPWYTTVETTRPEPERVT